MTQDQRFGLMTGMGAYFIWGFLPLYLALLRHIEPADFLAHRVLWSVPTGLLLVVLAGRWRDVMTILASRNALWLALASLLIGTNWLIFIWAVGQERVMEASLGYFINPLVNVAVAAIFLSEKLRRLQWVAVIIAAIAVTVETFALGRLPWVALALSATFASYGLIKRQLVVDSRVSFTVEVLFILPLAVLWIGVALFQGRNIVGNGGTDILLLLLAGPLTATPLLLFTLAARRLKFSTLGIMQYLGPSLQFGVALALGEMLTPVRTITFVLIWLAVILFSVDAIRFDRQQRKQRQSEALKATVKPAL